MLCLTQLAAAARLLASVAGARGHHPNIPPWSNARLPTEEALFLAFENEHPFEKQEK